MLSPVASEDPITAHVIHPDPGPGWQLRYWAIFGGQALSMIGSALTQFVLMWWITVTTGSISALATAGMVALLPQALLGPIGGLFADRYNRRVIMITADLVSAACMVVLIALFLTDAIALWHVYVMMFIRSAMQAFQMPASSASAAMLVPASFLPRAAGFSQMVFGIMTVAAAPLGALAMSVMPIGWALSIDVVTVLFGVVPLLVFAIPQQRIEPGARRGALVELKEGAAVIWHNVGLRQLYGLLILVVLVIMPSATLVPLLVREHFGGEAPQVAIMEGLGGVAMIAGGMVVAALAPKQLTLWIILGFSLSSLTLALVALAPSGMFWLAVVWWAISSIAFIMGSAPMTTLIQTRIPNQLQGRVLSLLSTAMALAAPIGLALATPLGELLGVRWLFVTVGLLSGAVCLLGLFSKRIRALDGVAG